MSWGIGKANAGAPVSGRLQQMRSNRYGNDKSRRGGKGPQGGRPPKGKGGKASKGK